MDVKSEIANIASVLENNYKEQGLFEIGIGDKMPDRSEIIDILGELRRLMFPGFFGHENTAYVSFQNFAGNTLANIYQRIFKQVRIALYYHAKTRSSSRPIDLTDSGCRIECNAVCSGNCDAGCSNENCSLESKAAEITTNFIKKFPEIQKMVFKDVEAELEGDPAAGTLEEVIFSYPGIYAILVFRIAHVFYEMNVPFIPRIMTEHAHSKTGIDINPGAKIGEYFFIDHGTGIVIGETTIIGNHVKIYQGVTLGALSLAAGQQLKGKKRHPTIEDNVVIYANTTVLGGDTVIGENSVIAGNTFIIRSIPKNTKVSSTTPELTIKERK